MTEDGPISIVEYENYNSTGEAIQEELLSSAIEEVSSANYISSSYQDQFIQNEEDNLQPNVSESMNSGNNFN